MQPIYTMKDGPAQEARDYQLLHEEPFDGYPNPLSDPALQKFLYEYDAAEAVKTIECQKA